MPLPDNHAGRKTHNEKIKILPSSQRQNSGLMCSRPGFTTTYINRLYINFKSVVFQLLHEQTYLFLSLMLWTTVTSYLGYTFKHLLTLSTCLLYCSSLATIFILSDACFTLYSDVRLRSDNFFNYTNMNE